MPTWIRVRDDITGAEFDIDERSLAARKGVTRVDGYPVRSGMYARPRKAKPRTDLAGKPVPPAPEPGDTEPTQSTTPAKPADQNEE